ncbi:hypothetical protein SDC9_123793 [bioreactor metagenome]|uniref:Uncharacterized protein n=1 Tax=bioreactor metagenome TaxID=1076179 RepID=A0A645CIN3_9ZZZZ
MAPRAISKGPIIVFKMIDIQHFIMPIKNLTTLTTIIPMTTKVNNIKAIPPSNHAAGPRKITIAPAIPVKAPMTDSIGAIPNALPITFGLLSI